MTVKLDRAAFFSAARLVINDGKRLTQAQVSGIEALLDEYERRGWTDPRWLAFMLATVKLETGNKYQPVYEKGARSYFNKYEPGTKIGKALGNTLKGDGYRFRGRGYPQLTGRANYAKLSPYVAADLVANPDLALQPQYAIPIFFEGMSRGLYTNRKLSDYFSATKDDSVGARRIVNGQDKAAVIAGYHRQFLAALQTASASVPLPRAKPAPEVVVTPVAGVPDPSAPTVDELDEGDRYKLQVMLQAKGFWDVGLIDGKRGARTDTALKAFKALNGLAENTIVDDATWKALEDGKSAPVSSDRASMTPKTAEAATGNPLFAWVRRTWNTLLYGGGTAAVGVAANETGTIDSAREATGLADTGEAVVQHATFLQTLLSVLKSVAETILDVIQWFLSHPALLLSAVGICVGFGIWKLAGHLIEQIRVGRLTS